MGVQRHENTLICRWGHFSSIFHIYHHLGDEFSQNIHLCNPTATVLYPAFVVAVSFCNCCCCGIFGCRTVKNPVGDGVGPISSENYGFCHTITRIYLIPLSTAIIRLQFTNPPVKLFCNKNIFPKNFKLTRARTALPDGQKSLATRYSR